jgi:NAD(P)-dependent dehydrogenase (short-subunit alcohol dehydrogenase family)
MRRRLRIAHLYTVMNLQLDGKRALVTGSTGGIGLAIATALPNEGATVIINGRTQERVDGAVRKSGVAYGIAAVLGTEAGARVVIARFPSVDILVKQSWHLRAEAV